MESPTIDDVIAAANRIGPYIHQTPLVRSNLLDQWLGHHIIFKAECLQKIGAFKARGGCNAIASLIERGNKPKRIIANSSGNHAQAIAWAASQFAIPATIYMPSFVSKVKAKATASYGAQIELLDTRDEVDNAVALASNQEGVHWIPPYNHPDVIAGQGTAALEALTELAEVDAIFAPCGGGGLLSGTAIAARSLSPRAQVIGVEPLNANDAAQSRRIGSIQRLTSTPSTLADGAMTPSVGDITFEFVKSLDEFYEVNEEAIQYWTQWLSHLLKLHVEPTSAMSMDGVCRWLQNQTTKKTILVILSGGNIDQQTSAKVWQKDWLDCTPDERYG